MWESPYNKNKSHAYIDWFSPRPSFRHKARVAKASCEFGEEEANYQLDPGKPVVSRSYCSLEPETSIYKWLFRLDDLESLHEKWLFHQTSILNWLFGVPGGTIQMEESENLSCMDVRLMDTGSFPTPKKAEHKVQETLHFRYLKFLVIFQGKFVNFVEVSTYIYLYTIIH